MPRWRPAPRVLRSQLVRREQRLLALIDEVLGLATYAACKVGNYLRHKRARLLDEVAEATSWRNLF